MNTENNWLESALGQYVLNAEKALYDQQVTDIFGFNALQIDLLEMNLLEQSRMPKQFGTAVTGGDLLTESEYLPFSAACMDLVCLPHALEFCGDPHQTLREIERILVPEGHVIITGFNPISTWGFRRKVSRHQAYPWCGRSLSSGRIKDWLALLGLETVDSGNLGYILPINDEQWILRQQVLERFSE